MRFIPSFLLCVMVAALNGRAAEEWREFGGDAARTRYSKLAQIHKGNVGQLRVAWTYDSRDAYEGSELQCNPLVIDGVLYGTTPTLKVFAVDAATGKLRWEFDPNDGAKPTGKRRNRGLNYWTDGKEERLYFGATHYLYALDAKSGKPAAGFGSGGKVDLRAGLGRPVDGITITLTTPGVVYKDLLIIGSLVNEGLPSAPGDIRAYDTRSGALKWSFHTLPHPGEAGYETWPKDGWKYLGGTNSWSGLTLDEKRGIVYAPTGSASFDFYGANRAGDNLYANCLIALRAESGTRVWHYQFVRHDVWDRDLPAAPTLLTVKQNGRLVDAVAQITKSGHLWLFERETGKLLVPVKEMAAPPSPVAGEVLAKKQVLPLAPPPFARQEFTEAMVTNRTPEAHRVVKERWKQVKSGPQFTPPSLEGTIIFPGFDGGGEWGGASFDPESRLLYVNSNEMPWILRIVPKPPAGRRTSGKILYARNCAGCHREDLGGSPPEFPALRGIGTKRSREELVKVIGKGSGRMPGFAHLGDWAVNMMTTYLLGGEDKEVTADPAAPVAAGSPIDQPYTTDGYNKFLDPEGYPAVTPPWGTLTAIDVDGKKIRWQIPFGEYPELAAKGVKDTGSENYGGGVVTRGGLLFIGATNFDKKFRAIDKDTGKVLWETTLPAAGNATPAVYEVNGRQYVVIAAGGGKSSAPSGSTWVAFALPVGTK